LADKAITDLNTIPGSVDDNNTWFAVAQSGTAYKVSGHEFTLALGTILDGHGGVKSIVYTPPVAPSLTGTMVITLADNSTTTVSIQNGKGISSIAKTGTSGLIDTYTITYNDATTQTFTVTNGAKGDTGDAWYVWIKYAGSQPTQDSDMGDTPDNWIGIYSGTSSTAPTSYTSYQWFEIKGEKGDTGEASAITSQSVTYLESTSGTVVPEGSWTTTVPSVTPGNFLWTRTILTWNDATSTTAYSVSRFGIDGTGAVSSVNNISPDSNGNIALEASNIPTNDSTSIQSHITQIESDISDAQGDIYDISTTLATTNTKLGKVVLRAAVQTVSANGTSSSISLTGLTADHVVGNWGMFSDANCTTPIPDNAPTCDITITTASGAWTYTIANFSSTFYLRPTFILKQN